MKIESRTGRAEFPAETIYYFISDFRNFNNFIPGEKVADWQANENACSFSVDMLGKVRMMIVERETNKMVKVSSDPKVSQYNFNLWIQLKELESADTRMKITIEPKLNPVMQAMVKSPLKKFVNAVMDEFEKFDFSS